MKSGRVAAGALLVAGYCAGVLGTPPEATAEAASGPLGSEAEIRTFCASCHRFPPPEIFPAAAWPRAFETMAFLFGAMKHPTPAMSPGSLDAMLPYFRDRAPQSIEVTSNSAISSKLSFEHQRIQLDGWQEWGMVTSLTVANLLGNKTLVITEDPGLGAPPTWSGRVETRQLGGENPLERNLASVASPVDAEVVDLDRDGIEDVIVADLGTFPARDHARGGVAWLRGLPSGSFHKTALIEGVGRVADVQAADVDGDGDIDLAVAVFGWHSTGNLFLLLQKDHAIGHTLSFELRLLSSADGASHVRFVDLNADGALDVIALFSQELEKVVAYINDGHGGFGSEQVLYQAPDPAWGSTGIETADLDHDGDVDVLLVAGDIMDTFVLRPTHGVYWLENQGSLPFRHQQLAALPAASALDVADLDGDGDLDIAAVAFLPPGDLPDWTLGGKDRSDFDSVIWLEQTSPGTFDRHLVASGPPRSFSVLATDVDGDQAVDLIVGNVNHPGLEPGHLSVFRQSPRTDP